MAFAIGPSNETFRKSRFFIQVKSSSGFSVSCVGRFRLFYKDRRGSIEIRGESSAGRRPFGFTVDVGSIPDTDERPRSEVRDNIARASLAAGWEVDFVDVTSPVGSGEVERGRQHRGIDTSESGSATGDAAGHTEGYEHAIRSFFSRVGRAGLLLPDGWVGGSPMAVTYTLTSVAEGSHQLLLELDSRTLLVFSGATVMNEGMSQEASLRGARILTFSSYSTCTFLQVEKGSRRPHGDTYRTGVIQLVGEHLQDSRDATSNPVASPLS